MGTLINAALIVAGGILGTLIGKKLDPQLQKTLMIANAVAVLFVGLGGAVSKMLAVTGSEGSYVLEAKGTMMLVISLAAGAVIGELLKIEQRIRQFGEWLKARTGNAEDRSFVSAFVTASLTVCVGAMAVIGSIQDGISGDPSILVTKGILDFFIILIMASSLGKGALFSFIPVAVFQGVITLLSRSISPYVTTAAMDALSYVGSVLIFCVGINLIWPEKIKVANLLPSLVIAVLFTVF